ncbi:protein of unknown function [Methylocaldum szegediense]|uniref:Transposase n=1 Tax=Methylocaldum szegediense TaxID=73780 RepID=A0ABM9I041_9GAMM|nr:protein of unknown function [Methylocaldum szegediense]
MWNKEVLSLWWFIEEVLTELLPIGAQQSTHERMQCSDALPLALSTSV